MDLNEALRTTGAVRDFDPAPVPDEVLYRVLDTARFAPSGGNRQAWHTVIVKDPDLRSKLRDLYQRGWYDYLALGNAGLVAWSPLSDRDAERAALRDAPRMAEVSLARRGGFAEHLEEVPALVVLLADLGKLATVDRDLDRYGLAGGASVYPFAWSILLAAHEEGLGGVITTMLVRAETEVLELLGAPPGYAVAAGIVLGYPAGAKRATRLRRAPVEGFATVDRFDGEPLTPD